MALWLVEQEQLPLLTQYVPTIISLGYCEKYFKKKKLLDQASLRARCRKVIPQDFSPLIKGGDAKTRPPKTFICSKFKVLYLINNIFWQHQRIVEIKFLNCYKTHFSWTLKKVINNFAKKTFSVSEGALFKSLKLWSAKWKIHANLKVKIIFLWQHQWIFG